MPLKHSSKGEIVEDWYEKWCARFRRHLDSKKAGPLVCPICKAADTFEPAGALGAPPEDITSRNPQFGYASCTNCGYSIFFNSDKIDVIYGKNYIEW